MGERRSATIIGTLVVVAVVSVLGWTVMSSETKIPLTEVTDAAAIHSAIKLSPLSILTSENYFGQKVRIITGVLENVSAKPVRLVELKMAFTDSEGKSIQEGTYPAFANTQRPLVPGGKVRFEQRFENLPKNWNYRIPVTEIVKVAF